MFEKLVTAWNNVGIAASILGFLRRRLASLGGVGKEPRSVAGISELGEAFSEDWLGFGDRLRIRGRLSRFAPIYFPVAYSPQIPGAVTGGNVVMQTAAIPNPAPAAFDLRRAEGGYLVFLFGVNSECTPRITSPIHRDRLQRIGGPPPLPGAVADPSIPVLIDHDQLDRVEQRVELQAQLVPLDEDVLASLAASSEDFVRLYYHGFYSEARALDPGYMLDARKSSGGTIRLAEEPTPFLVNVGFEFGFHGDLRKDEMEAAINEWLDAAAPEGALGLRHRYVPSYTKAVGYEIMQIARTPLAAHLAYDQGVLHVSAALDSTGDMGGVSRLLIPQGKALLKRLRKLDPKLEVKPLFQSHQTFPRRLGL